MTDRQPSQNQRQQQEGGSTAPENNNNNGNNSNAQSMRSPTTTTTTATGTSTRQQAASRVDPQIIDEILAFITSVDEHDNDQMKSMANKLNQLPEPHFQASTTTQLDPLTVLDPAEHSLGYLYFLQVYLNPLFFRMDA